MLITSLPTPARPMLAAWSEGHLLVADSAGNTWLDGREQVRLGDQILSVTLSKTGAFATARLADGRVLIWSTSDLSVRELTMQGLDAVFALRESDEVVAILLKHELALWSPSGQIVARQPLGGLAASSLVRVADGRGLVVVGQEFAESRDTIVLFDASELAISNDLMGRRFRFSEGLVDSSNVLAVGPCGPDRVVVFRDPQETEDPLEPGERAIVPREWGFRGFYVATRNGDTVQHLQSELQAVSGGTIVAGETYIAMQIAGQIALLSRHDGSIQRLDLRWLGSATSSAVLGIDANDVLQLVELE